MSSPTPHQPSDPRQAFHHALESWRALFFRHLSDLVHNSPDEHVRLAATLGGLRALATIEAADQRNRRLAQHDRALDLARRHLDLQALREARRHAERDDHEHHVAVSDAACVAPPAPADPSRPARQREPEPSAPPEPRDEHSARFVISAPIRAVLRGAITTGVEPSAASDAPTPAAEPIAAASSNQADPNESPRAPAGHSIALDPGQLDALAPAPDDRPAESTIAPRARSHTHHSHTAQPSGP